MRASPFRMSPSSTVIMSRWSWYGIELWYILDILRPSCHYYVSKCMQEWVILDCPLELHFLLWVIWNMVIAMSSATSGPTRGEYLDSCILQQASPSQDDTWWWCHSSVVWAASVGVELGYQQGSSGWFAPGACGHSLWWRHSQRHRCEIVQFQRCKLTSHILCWHIVAL